PFDELPQATDPPAGHFASANNKIVPESYPYFVSRDWDLPNRVERIEELLGAEPRQSLAASAAMQADTVSIMARRLMPLMTQIQPEGDLARGRSSACAGGISGWMPIGWSRCCSPPGCAPLPTQCCSGGWAMPPP